MPKTFSPSLVDRIIKGRCAELAALLGLHRTANNDYQLTVFWPGARSIVAVSRSGKKMLGTLECVHSEGLFSGTLTAKRRPDYRLLVDTGEGVRLQDDPYRFQPLDEGELSLIHAGLHDQSWRVLGAQPSQRDDCAGTQFLVWAPEALRVSVLIEQSGWDGRAHVMHRHAASGIWELFMPNLGAGSCYQLEWQLGRRLVRSGVDPFARAICVERGRSLIASEDAYVWHDHEWCDRQRDQARQGSPLVIKQLNLGSVGRNGRMHWRQFADEVCSLARERGFTHLLLKGGLAGNMSQQGEEIAWLASSLVHGNSPPLQAFIEEAHRAGIGVCWEFSLQRMLAQLVMHGDNALTVDWQHHGPALHSLVVGVVDYWVTHWHVDGVEFCELDPLVAQARQGGGFGVAAVREWVRDLLQRLRRQHAALLLFVTTEEDWPELTLSAELGGMGADHRQRRLQQGPQHIPEQVIICADGNTQHGIQACDLTAQLSLENAQMQALVQWVLPGAKCVVDGSDWRQPEQGHDWAFTDCLPWSTVWWSWLTTLNHVYRHQPALYELDGNREGIAVHCNDGAVLVIERLARNLRHNALVLLNLSDTPQTVLLSGAIRPGRLLLQCGVGGGASALPSSLQFPLSSQAPALTLPARCGALYCLA